MGISFDTAVLRSACYQSTVLYSQKGSSDSSHIPAGCKHPLIFSARLRLDYENFDAPVFTGLLRVTIGGKANTKSILMVTPYSNMSLTRHIVTVSISVGGQN